MPVGWHGSSRRHLGEVADSERGVARGCTLARPYVLVAQQSIVDPDRAPAGMHTLWAYCHVPSGSPVDMTDAIQSQIERFAPGFGELVLARATRGPAQMEAENPNYVGGDINCGSATLVQTFIRPRCAPRRTRHRIRACSCARRPRLRAGACTACAGTTRPGWRSAERCAGGSLRLAVAEYGACQKCLKSGSRVVQTACILCECNCGIEVELDDRRLARIRGDRATSASQGYTCNKAMRLDHYQNGRHRLTSPLRRRTDGSFEEISWDVAITEVAARFAAVRDTHGG